MPVSRAKIGAIGLASTLAALALSAAAAGGPASSKAEAARHALASAPRGA